MSDSIFLVGDDGSLTKARSATYSVEAELQKLLADNIHLLPGEQISPGNPRRWLLIKREAGVPNHEGGGRVVVHRSLGPALRTTFASRALLRTIIRIFGVNRR